MLSQQENDELTRVGPDTGAGAVLRQYWQPAALSIELDGPRPAVPVRLLGEDRVEIEEVIESGRGFREAGNDLCEGQTILSPGEILTSQRIALLASQGCCEVEVRPQVRARVISTGDELKPVGDSLAPGELYESNALMLCAMGAEQGFPG